MRVASWLVLLTIAAACLTLPARAEPYSGAIVLQDTLVVGENETLDVGPGTSITGSGSIEVHGSLNVSGDPDRRVEIAVPIVLLGHGSSRIADARLYLVNGTALTVRDGNLTMTRVAFEGNGAGLVSTTPGAIVLRDALFRAHATEAARITGATSVTIERLTVQDGHAGLVLDLTRATVATLANATFERNVQHALVQMGPEPADVRLSGNTFGPARSDTPALPALTVRGTLVPDGVSRSVTLRDDAFVSPDVGLRVEGAGFALASTNDSFLGARIGISLSGANVALKDASFNTTEHDIENAAGSVVRMENVRLTTGPGEVSAAALAGPAPTGWPSWALPAGIAVVATAGAGALLWRRRGGGRGAEGGGAPQAEAPSALRPEPAAPVGLSAMEQRILADVAANPGTAQSATATRLGLSRQALHYHVKKLEARGLITKEAHGRETRCALTDLGRASLAASQLGSEEKP